MGSIALTEYSRSTSKK